MLNRFIHLCVVIKGGKAFKLITMIITYLWLPHSLIAFTGKEIVKIIVEFFKLTVILGLWLISSLKRNKNNWKLEFNSAF